MLAKIGHFDILELLGRGAMGSVYRAIDPIIGRSVAIKLIRLIGYNDGEEAAFLKERLFKEAKAAGSLSHPGIVTIYQVGTQDDQAFIVMEYIDGATLESRLVEDTPADAPFLSRVLLETAAALDYAHQRGIVHRDIKPANIMLTGSGSVKITDFGIAKTLLGHTVTQSGMILGTPFYMSPEQVQGQVLDGRSDQFALAVIAYQMLTGRKPFQGEQVTSICYQIVHAEPPPIADIKPDLSPAAARVLHRGLEKNPAKRFPTCAEFATALIQACEQRVAPLVSASAAATAALPEHAAARPIPPPKPRPNPSGPPALRKYLPQLAMVLGALAVIVLIAGAVSLFRSRPVSRAAPGTERPTPASAGTQAPYAAVPAAPPAVPAQPAAAPTVKSQPASRQTSSAASVPEPANKNEAAAKSETAPRQSPIGGRIVWTGVATRGTLLQIENDRASTGIVRGRFPGGPVEVQVFPADNTGDGLTVFTSDEKYATPVSETTASGVALFSWDPRHATDLTVWEEPGPGNEWGRVVVRVNSAKLTSCIVEWKRKLR